MRLQAFPQTYLLWLKIIGQTMPVTNTADYERPIDHFLKPSVRLKADVSKISNLFFFPFSLICLYETTFAYRSDPGRNLATVN